MGLFSARFAGLLSPKGGSLPHSSHLANLPIRVYHRGEPYNLAPPRVLVPRLREALRSGDDVKVLRACLGEHFRHFQASMPTREDGERIAVQIVTALASRGFHLPKAETA